MSVPCIWNFERTTRRGRVAVAEWLESGLVFGAAQHFPKGLTLGVAGYYYDQVTGDSGSGDPLGSFKGRVTAVGPFLGYDFKMRGRPVSAKLRWLHEFDVTNRLEGDVGVLNVAFPLGGSGPPPAK